MTSLRPATPGYQRRDWEIVDYEGYQLDETGLWFRGPRRPLEPGRYVVCIGAAQTYGCFCREPFPALLETSLGIPVLNLGYGGAGPRFFLEHPLLLEYVNQSRVAIFQVMSARSESNSLFDSGGLEILTRRADGARVPADEAYDRLLRPPADWWPLPIGRGTVRRALGLLYRRAARRVVEETRQNWIESFCGLLDGVRVPRILFWFSKRSPNYAPSYASARALFGEAPQLVDARMVEEIRGHADVYVECVTRRSSPQRLVSRFSGEPTTVDLGDIAGERRLRPGAAFNHYYPSPEMHRDAAEALEPHCRAALQRTGAGVLS